MQIMKHLHVFIMLLSAIQSHFDYCCDGRDSLARSIQRLQNRKDFKIVLLECNEVGLSDVAFQEKKLFYVE
jgi:hypothetical protein